MNQYFIHNIKKINFKNFKDICLSEYPDDLHTLVFNLIDLPFDFYSKQKRNWLVKKANLNKPINDNAQTILHLISTKKTSAEWEDLIIKNTSDIHIRDNDGNTAIALSAIFGNQNLFSKLLKKGANPFNIDDYGVAVFDILKYSREPEKQEIYNLLKTFIEELKLKNKNVLKKPLKKFKTKII